MDVELIPGGSDIDVTMENRTEYIHRLVHYHCNAQLSRAAESFLQGITAVVPRRWLLMFDPSELNMCISGESRSFDVDDLAWHTQYSHGYTNQSPTIKYFWEVLHEFDDDLRSKFLMFVTSCSRAPLMGFKNMSPLFGIQYVNDATRLPTAATCANHLKLPDYQDKEVLREKLTMAISSEAGFGMS
jgi:ubiquitin-protein ligase E3 C